MISICWFRSLKHNFSFDTGLLRCLQFCWKKSTRCCRTTAQGKSLRRSYRRQSNSYCFSFFANTQKLIWSWRFPNRCSSARDVIIRLCADEEHEKRLRWDDRRSWSETEEFGARCQSSLNLERSTDNSLQKRLQIIFAQLKAWSEALQMLAATRVTGLILALPYV